MMELLKNSLLVINIVSFVCVLIFGVFGIVEYILGPTGAEKLLKSFNIPWSYHRVLGVAFICLTIMIISYIVRKKFFG